VIRKSIKCAVLTAVASVGVFAAVNNSRWRRRRLVILCYHGLAIDDEHLWAPSLFVDAPRFESRLRFLVERYNVLPLAEAVTRLYDGTLPPRSAAITFDDGTSDFFRIALPLLRQYRLPATVYLTTYYCGRSQPVTPIFYDYLLWKGRGAYGGGKLPELDAGVPVNDAAARWQTVMDLESRIREQNWTVEDRVEYARRLAAALGVDYEALAAARILQIMTPDEVAESAAAGVDIQLHTHRHRTPAARDLFLREIDDNRLRIREICASDADHFCYPSGVYDEQFLPWLRERGVRSATTCDSGVAAPSDDPLLLPRVVDTCLLQPVEFESWLCGFSAWLRPRRRAF
jgi:peptidoglycan/xylan/chitin deacetylase (PgdA/CDA1 family)